jgi:hypothetical protein
MSSKAKDFLVIPSTKDERFRGYKYPLNHPGK